MVPGVIVIGAVAIFLLVVLVVFLVVANQILKCKTIVSGHKIDAGGWMSAVALIQIATSRNAITELRQLTLEYLQRPQSRTEIPPPWLVAHEVELATSRERGIQCR